MNIPPNLNPNCLNSEFSILSQIEVDSMPAIYPEKMCMEFEHGAFLQQYSLDACDKHFTATMQ